VLRDFLFARKRSRGEDSGIRLLCLSQVRGGGVSRWNSGRAVEWREISRGSGFEGGLQRRSIAIIVDQNQQWAQIDTVAIASKEFR
jgi:hypothetical protein